jgi:hypothetical protein
MLIETNAGEVPETAGLDSEFTELVARQDFVTYSCRQSLSILLRLATKLIILLLLCLVEGAGVVQLV